MFIAVDSGNTRIKMAAFVGDTIVSRRAVPSVPDTMSADILRVLSELVESCGATAGPHSVAIACVTPRTAPVLREAALALSGRSPFFVGHQLDLGLDVAVTYPERLGADRIANAVAAATLHGAPVIALDFGTTITATVVSADRRIIGGSIAPGLRTAARALALSTGQLPEVCQLLEAAMPDPIGADTEAAIRSGILYGAIGMVRELMARMRGELASNAPVVATGGAAEALAPHCGIGIVAPDLTLTGIRLIAQRNGAIEPNADLGV
jgi:type III pantothenate kinase